MLRSFPIVARDNSFTGFQSRTALSVPSRRHRRAASEPRAVHDAKRAALRFGDAPDHSTPIASWQQPVRRPRSGREASPAHGRTPRISRPAMSAPIASWQELVPCPRSRREASPAHGRWRRSGYPVRRCPHLRDAARRAASGNTSPGRSRGVPPIFTVNGQALKHPKMRKEARPRIPAEYGE